MIEAAEVQYAVAPTYSALQAEWDTIMLSQLSARLCGMFDDSDGTVSAIV